MARVTEVWARSRGRPLFMLDFSPPRGPDFSAIDALAGMPVDFVDIAYNPAKSVRADPVAVAVAVRERTGLEPVFNLATRDMNRLALQSHLLGASLLGLQNVLVVAGDPFTEEEQKRVRPVHDYSPLELIRAIQDLNAGVDYRGLRLRQPTDFCVGAVADPERGIRPQARQVRKKVEAGARFIVTQPVYDPAVARAFLDACAEELGRPLEETGVPIFIGLQMLVKGGLYFGPVPEKTQVEVEAGRPGLEVARELLDALMAVGVTCFYLVPPILPMGRRDYGMARALLEEVRARPPARP